MKKTEETLQDIIREEKKTLFLAQEEKDAIRSNLMAFMEQHPAPSKPANPVTAWLASFKLSSMPYAPALLSLLVVVFAGGGIAFAAQDALPGQPLYTVKTEVNERVLGWMAVSDEQKAELHITLAKERLWEVETIALKGKLTGEAKAQAEASFNKQINSAQKKLKSLTNTGVSADLESHLESVLSAHATIITDLPEEHGDKKQTSAFAEGVVQRISEIKKQRQETEKKNIDGGSAKTRALANNALNRAENKLDMVTEFAEKHKDRFSSESYTRIELAIESASTLITNGKTELDGQNYEAAYLSFQQATRELDQIDVNASARVELKANIPFPQIGITGSVE